MNGTKTKKKTPQCGDIVSPATERDARCVGQTFRAKITTSTVFKILLDVKDGASYKGKESGFVVARINKNGQLDAG